MKRPAGVIVSIVLLALGGVLCLIYAASILSIIDDLPLLTAQPALMRAAALLAVGLLVLSFLWQLATVVGLWLLKPWGRVSVLVFSGLLVSFLLLSLLLLLLSPFSQRAIGSEEQVAIVVEPGITAAFYGVPITIGVCWLIYFTRPTVKALFTSAKQTEQAPARPLSIIVMAWAMVLTAALWPFAVYWQWASFFLWMVLTGWSGVIANTMWCAASAYAGIKLLRWTRHGYVVSMWLFGIATATVILFWIMPGAQARSLIIENTHAFPEIEMFTTGAWFWLIFAILLLGLVVPAGYLYAHRSEFKG